MRYSLETVSRECSDGKKIVYASNLMKHLSDYKQNILMDSLREYKKANREGAYHDLVCIGYNGEDPAIGWSQVDAIILVLLWEATGEPPLPTRSRRRL